MADPSAYMVASWLTSDLANENFRPMLDCAIEVLGSHRPARSAEEQADYAEQILSQIVASLDKKREEAIEDGVLPSFELSTDAGTPYIRAVKSQANETLSRLLDLEWNQFEKVCAEVLEKMGCRSDVRGRPSDGGVDFVGYDLPLYPQATKGARILVIGQAKRYKRTNLVTINELRLFVGGALHVTSDPSESMFRRHILAPVMYAFWTTSDFLPSARSYAREIGLWYLSGLALAQLIDRLGAQIG